jgi:kynurenine formamidase
MAYILSVNNTITNKIREWTHIDYPNHINSNDEYINIFL